MIDIVITWVGAVAVEVIIIRITAAIDSTTTQLPGTNRYDARRLCFVVGLCGIYHQIIRWVRCGISGDC